LRFAGYEYLMVEGAAKEPVYLYINNDQVEIRSAKHLWGKIVDDTENLIREETHPEVRVASIGPAGENRARTACVMNDQGRAAAASGRLWAPRTLKRSLCLALRDSRSPTLPLSPRQS